MSTDLQKTSFRLSEVIAYLEEKIIEGNSSENEELWYQEINSGVIKKNSILKMLMDEMHSIYNGK